MQMERILPRYQLVPLTFTQDALAASQTDVQLNIIETAATTGTLGVTEYVLRPFTGWIIACSVTLEGTAATAGSLTVGPTLNGTEKTALQQSMTTGKESGSKLARPDWIPFELGDNLGCEITTSGTWDGTGLDLVAFVWVVLDLDGV